MALSLLAACATPPPPFPLSVERRSAQQQVELTVRGQTYRFNAVAQSGAQGLSLIVLGPMNARVLTLSYKGQGIALEKGVGAPERLDAQRVLSDFQLLFLPLAELQSQPDLGVIEPQAGLRVVTRGGRPYASIQYAGSAPWNGRSILTNLSPGYQLVVDSIEILE